MAAKPGYALLALALLLTACSSPLTSSQPRSATPSATSTESPSPSPTATPAPLSLQQLFHPTGSVPNDPAHVRTMIATGDIIPARMVYVETLRQRDFLWAFRPTASYVRNADITFINLEAPLISGCRASETGMTFCGDPKFVNGLLYDGVKVANLANNHSGNYGNAGVAATAGLLQNNGIKTCGLGVPAIVNVRGLRFAFLGFNGVEVPHIDRAEMAREIHQARGLADVVVVQFHWGKEYERLPVPAPGVAPDDPVQIGHLAIDDGADMVIGNHPHWFQAVEMYKGHLVTYAHGNFVFDQMWSEETREGVVGLYTFYDTHLVRVEWKPVRIYDWGQPRFMDPVSAQQLLAVMERASRQLAAKLGEPV